MRSTRLHSLLLVLLDAIATWIIFNFCGWLRGIVPFGDWIAGPLAGPFIILFIGIYLIDGYRSRTAMMGADYTSQHVVAVVVAMFVTLLLTFAVIPQQFPLKESRAVIALSFLILAALTLTYRRSIHRWKQSDDESKFVLFLGDRASCTAFRQTCKENGLNQKIVCAITGEATEPPMEFGNDASIRLYRAVIEEIRAGSLQVEAIVLRESSGTLPGDLADELTELYFDGVPTFTLELFFETYWRKIPLYRINYVWLFQEGFQIARSPVFERTKRMVDIATSALGILLVSPVLICAAIAIKIEDGGPVFFRQLRIGRNRLPFSILKLRTMRVKAPTAGAGDARYTQKNDPRITRVGNFLRKSRLDEVPQLWNVLKGEMSLIGPRAEWDQLVREYETAIPCYHFRHLVRPGITGWAQINYPYGANIDDTLRKLEFDLYYIRHFSFVMDAAIVLRTLHIMLFGKGQ